MVVGDGYHMEFRFRKKRLNPFIPQVMVIRSDIDYDVPAYP